MTTEQLLAKFNPANAANLTNQDLLDMRNLTDKEIDQLANAYPNQPTRRPYLRLYDTTKAENKQLFNLSTWQNLRNVRKFSNMKNLVPYDFISSPGAFADQQRQQVKNTSAKATSPKKVVVDLSATEAAAELKAATAKTAGPAANVEKKPLTTAPVKSEKQPKPATSPKKAATGPAKNKAAAVVEKSDKAPGTDASEQFAPVN